MVPKTLVCLREGYRWPAFGRDAMAGLVVGIVALPLALAFAIFGRRNIAQSMTSAMQRAKVLVEERRGVAAPTDQRG